MARPDPGPTPPVAIDDDLVTRRWFDRLLVIGFCSWPYVEWCRSPSLFDDDLTRVGSFRRSTVLGSLLRPFNEHVAPLFEGVGWLAWWGSGGRVDAVAGGFLVASLAAAVLAAISLGLVVRLELGSAAPAWVAVGLFTWSSAAAETVLWYSASSFLWAASASLLAWAAAVRAVRDEPDHARTFWLGLTVLGAGAAPSFSAVGILAGPLVTVRLILARCDDDRAGAPPPPRSLACLVPLGGTLLYLGLLTMGHGDDAVATSVRRHLDPGAAAWAALRAPSLVVIPSLAGFAPLVGRLPDGVAAGLSGALGVVALIRLALSRRRRAFLAVCLAWVVGGYALVYATRAHSGDDWVLAVGRYHLFPLIGIVGFLAAVVEAGPIALRRCGRLTVPLAASGLVLAGWCWFLPGWRLAAVPLRFPDQPGVIAAVLRLEVACRLEGVPLAQAIRIVPPTVPRWFPRPLGFHPLLYLFGPDSVPETLADGEARSRILARLAPADRAEVFGGLDLEQAGLLAGVASIPPATTMITLAAGASGRSLVAGEGWLSWQEYEAPAAAPAGLIVDPSPGRIEVWWAGAGADAAWTARQSVRLPPRPVAAVILFDRLPHWQPQAGRRFRLIRRGRPWARGEAPVLRLFLAPAAPPGIL